MRWRWCGSLPPSLRESAGGGGGGFGEGGGNKSWLKAPTLKITYTTGYFSSCRITYFSLEVVKYFFEFIQNKRI
jgi:hypothetical protein